MKPTKCPQNCIFVICFIYSRYWSRIQYEVKKWSRFCPHWYCTISGRVWSFFVIQLLKYIKKKKSLNGHTVWRMIQKNRSTAGPLRQKGNAVISANFHKCNVHSVPLAKWKEYHFLNIGAFLIEIIPLENHTHGNIPFLIFSKWIDRE